MLETLLGGKMAICWFSQWYRSRLVAWPQCWLPATIPVGLSIWDGKHLALDDHGPPRMSKSGVQTLVVEMPCAIGVKEAAIGIIHEMLSSELVLIYFHGRARHTCGGEKWTWGLRPPV